MANMVKLQIGKNGLTEEFLENLKRIFKEAESVRVSVLKHGTRDKNQLKEWSNKMLSLLGSNFTSNIVGYTIVLRKWRKPRTKS